MSIYNKYPMMKPFIGRKYGQGNKPSLLLVGESHYFPKNSSNYVSADIWYSGISEKLTEEEIKWISTSKIIEESKVEGFKIKPHSIWKNSFRVINQYGPEYEDYTLISDDIAFCNFFLRPAKKGKSLLVKPQDVTVANETLLYNYKKLKPTGIIFLSRLAFQHFAKQEIIGIPVIDIPHPGCVWWNRKAVCYGDKSGKEVLSDFIKSLSW